MTNDDFEPDYDDVLDQLSADHHFDLESPYPAQDPEGFRRWIAVMNLARMALGMEPKEADI